MKYLLVLVVVLVGAWLLLGRRRGPDRPSAPAPKPAKPPQATAMLACAHCGVHLPSSEAAFDAAGRPFCGDAHRALGVR